MANPFGSFATGLRDQLTNPLFLGGAGMMSDGWSGAQHGMRIGAGIQEQDAATQRRNAFGKLAQSQQDPQLRAILSAVDSDAGAELLLNKMMKQEDIARAEQRYAAEQKFEREKWDTNKRYIEAQTQRMQREPDGNVPSGYRWSGDRSRMEFVPGGPADPSVANSGKVVPANVRSDAIKAEQAYATLAPMLDDFASTVKSNGRAILLGAEADAVARKRRNIQLQMKELYNLGVLNGPDLELMDSMLIDPGAMSNWGPGFQGRARSNIDDLKNNILLKMRNAKTSIAGIPDAQPSPLPGEDGGKFMGQPLQPDADGWVTVKPGVRIQEIQ